MRAAQAACWLAVVGVLFVPTGCSNESEGSVSAAGTSVTTVVPHGDHSDHPSTTAAVATTVPSRIDIVAREFEWSGLPDELPAGTYPMSFVNEGAEAHEISIFRNTERLAFEELFKLGPEGIKRAVEMVGTLMAGPGMAAASELSVTLTPGEYDVVCFFPATGSDMEPHFAHGMHRKLVVV